MVSTKPRRRHGAHQPRLGSRSASALTCRRTSVAWLPRRADSQVILVAPEDAENAMLSDDEEDTVVDVEQVR
jgi:hypothetical protein